MRFLLFSAFFFFCNLLNADILIVEGKPFKIEPTKLNICGEVGDPNYHAALMLLSSAQSLGELNADALCKAGDTKMCSLAAKKKFGVELLFIQTRKYPSRHKSTACLTLRKECERMCESSQIFTKEDCLIECNQYESYNR